MNGSNSDRDGVKVSAVSRLASLAPGGLFILFLALYLWSHIANFFNRDPLYYALQTETWGWGSLFFDRHHLLYRPVARLWYLLWQALGYEGGAIFPLQVLSALAGAGAVALFYCLVLRLAGGRRIAVLAALLLGVSYGFWRYSAEAYPHILLPFFCILSALCLTAGLQAAGWRRRLFALAWAGVFCALAALFYQTGVLFILPAVVVLLFCRPAGGGARGAGFFAFLAPCVLIIAAAFCALAASEGVWVGEIFTFAHGTSGWMGYGRFDLSNMWRAFIGAGNLFIGEVFAREHLAGMPVVSDWLVAHSAIPSAPIDNAPASPLRLWALYALLAGAVFALGWLVVLIPRAWREMGKRYRRGRLLGVAWLAPFAAFVIWWFPENRQYWLGALAGLVLLVALAAEAMGRRRLLGAAIVLLFAVNLLGSIMPDRRPENNPLLMRTRAVETMLSPQDVVVCVSAGELKHLSTYFEYYLRAETADILGLFFNAGGWAAGEQIIAAQMARARRGGGEVFVTGEARGTPLVCAQIARYHALTPREVQAVLDEFWAEYEMMPAADYRGETLLFRAHRAERAGGE